MGGPQEAARTRARARRRRAAESLERVERGGIPLQCRAPAAPARRGQGSLHVRSVGRLVRPLPRTRPRTAGPGDGQLGLPGRLPAGWPGSTAEASCSSCDRSPRHGTRSATWPSAAWLRRPSFSGPTRSWASRSKVAAASSPKAAIECVVIGTAVRMAAGRCVRPRGRPVRGTVLTELSVPDFAKLRRAGIETLGVVAWTSVFFVQLLGHAAGSGGSASARCETRRCPNTRRGSTRPASR